MSKTLSDYGIFNKFCNEHGRLTLETFKLALAERDKQRICRNCLQNEHCGIMWKYLEYQGKTFRTTKHITPTKWGCTKWSAKNDTK